MSEVELSSFRGANARRAMTSDTVSQATSLALTMYRLSSWLKSPRPYLMLIGFAGFLGFDGRVERQQVRLVGHLRNCGDDLTDIAGLLAQHSQLGVDRASRLHNMAHSLFHMRETVLSSTSQSSRVFGHRGNVTHSFDQLLGGRRNFFGRGTDFSRGRRNLAGRGLLLL
jgi:hypothetical protein